MLKFIMNINKNLIDLNNYRNSHKYSKKDINNYLNINKRIYLQLFKNLQNLFLSKNNKKYFLHN